METYYSDTSKDSSSSYSYTSNSSTHPLYDHNQTKSRRQKPAFHSALHSVRKFPAKNVITKKSIAPMAPTPAKVYKVGPLEFKDVVQKLTGAQTRLQEVAPPPLSLSPIRQQPREPEHTFGGLISPVGFSLSPASVAWCSSMLLSPGTLATFEPSVLTI